MYDLGQILITKGVKLLFDTKQISELDVIGLLSRHKQGDWGNLDEQDEIANVKALEADTRILSNYLVNSIRLWIITEADRSSTCILRPEEY